VAWFLGQSLLTIVAAFLLGLFVGWLWWGRRRADEEAPAGLVRAIPRPIEPSEPVAAAPVEAAVADEPAAAPVEEAAVEEAVVEEPAVEEPAGDDDLERVEGIGPRMATALRGAGIRTFRQLAESDEAALRAAIEVAGLKFAPSLVTWARQAQLLADGDEEGFADLARRLVAGRDVGRQ